MLYRYHVAARLEDLTRRTVMLGFVPPGRRLALARVESPVVVALAATGMSGGGMVKVRATAKGRILGVEIDDSLLQPSEKSMVEDLVAAAINDARGKADSAAAAEMQKMQGSLSLPPGFKLPF